MVTLPANPWTTGSVAQRQIRTVRRCEVARAPDRAGPPWAQPPRRPCHLPPHAASDVPALSADELFDRFTWQMNRLPIFHNAPASELNFALVFLQERVEADFVSKNEPAPAEAPEPPPVELQPGQPWRAPAASR